MKDVVGKKLMEIRKNNIIPLIRGSLLDVGCGNNVIVRAYRALSGKDAIGVDVYPWEGVDIVVQDSASLPFDSHRFDTIICVAALNHIPNRIKVIQEMKRLLKTDGQIIITMITPKISQVWHLLRSPWDDDQKERGMQSNEVFGFTRQEISAMFENYGFITADIKPFMFGLNRIYLFLNPVTKCRN